MSTNVRFRAEADVGYSCSSPAICRLQPKGLVMFAMAFLLLAAAPVDVRMTAASPAASAALQHPRVAAALDARMKIQSALVAGKSEAFGSGFTPDAVVNSPFNNVATAAEAARRSRAGALDYKYIHTSIEYAAPRRNDEVIFLGEETYEYAAGMPQAGKILRRRFTDLYRKVDGKWLRSLRQATIVSND